MAAFVGTSGIDNLVGTAGVVDNVRVQVGSLRLADTVFGGEGPVVDLTKWSGGRWHINFAGRQDAIIAEKI